MSYKTTLGVDNGHLIVLKEYGLRETTGNISSSFLLLTDTPTTYAGSENFGVRVNSTGTGLEFVEGGGGTGAVTSVFGRDGVVIAEVSDYASFYADINHTHVEADITDLDKYTQAEVDAAISAIQGFSGSYSDLTDVPTEFTPSAHTHTEADITDLDKYTKAEVDAAVAGATSDVVDDTTPQLGGSLDTNGHSISSESGTDMVIDVKGMASGSSFKLKSDTTEVMGISFDGTNFVMDLDNGGLQTRIVGLPTAQTPLPSEALSYQFLVDNGVLNPMVASLDANQNDMVNANILFFGDTSSGSSTSGIASNAQALAAIPAITSTQTAGLTSDPADNMVLIVPEENQPFAVSSDSGTSITLRYPTVDGTNGQILTTDGAGNATWEDNIHTTPPVLSVDGRTGEVTLDDLYAAEAHTHTEDEITDLDKYTQAEVDAKDAALQLNIDGKADTLHTHVKADITDFSDADYATAAQGALADTALQSGDNVSELVNDAGYITEDAVTSVHGRTGDVVAENLDYFYYHVGAESVATGLLTGGEISLNGNSIDFTGGTGYIVDTATDYFNPDFARIDFTGGNVPFTTTQGVTTWLYIDFNGLAQTQTVRPSNEEIKQNIYLGFVVASSSGHVLQETYDQVGSTANDVNELMRFHTGVTDGAFVTPNVNTTFAMTDAEVYQPNVNRRNNPLDPNVTTYTGGNPLSFSYMTQDGFITSTGTNVRPTEYNPSGGTITILPDDNNTTSIQYLYLTRDGQWIMLYGQRLYSSASSARRDLDADISLLNEPNALTGAYRLYAFIMEEDTDNLTDTGDANIVNLNGITSDVSAITSVFGRTGDIVAEEGDYSAFYVPTSHLTDADPHPQYLTAEDLPETLVSWYTDEVSSVDGAYLKVSSEVPTGPTSSISATGVTQGVPTLLGQWIREPAFDEDFELFETQSTFQFEMDSSNNNVEFYVEFWKLEPDTTETLLATSDVYPMSSDRKIYTGVIITPGPVTITAGDRTFTRLYINKNVGGADPTVTLFMEGNGVTRVVTTLPIATFPAPHAASHEVGGTDQIDHDNLLNASGNDSHATIDSKIASLEASAFLDGDTIDNGTY